MDVSELSEARQRRTALRGIIKRRRATISRLRHELERAEWELSRLEGTIRSARAAATATS